MLDAVGPAGIFVGFFVVTAKPIFAGTVALAACATVAFADKAKRAALREPLVFTDISQLRELVRHPHLYLPFAGAGRLIAIGAGGTLVALVLAFVLDPRAVHWLAVSIGAFAALIVIPGFIGGRCVGPIAQQLRRLAPSGDLVYDTRRFGPFATLALYGFIARDERPGRRAAVRPGTGRRKKSLPRQPPIILVQSESFFDAGRLPILSPDLLPILQRTRRSSVQWGRLAVPSWGANTARTEFAVLTGISETALAFDRFNPYHAFAKAPVDSLAWTLKREGYRTFCIHPFDRTFYRRHRIMPSLGFDHFFAAESFRGAERIGSFVSDRAVARFCAELLEYHRDLPAFLFVITMENHGPWPCVSAPRGFVGPAERLRDLPKGEELGRYLQTLSHADAMIGLLTEILARDGRSGLLGFYGDHLPSFPAAFERLQFSETSTDYLLWRANASPPRLVDIAAHELSAAILAALRTPMEVGPARWRAHARASGQ
ncbi:MAG TPA: LTA synthase family protein [Xanthobacteraceae bacterium]|jgi:hypothetical protein|nr:LTA synthase family protein [Xanthobacteraceae bacterium]